MKTDIESICNPNIGYTGTTVFIPQCKVEISKTTTDHLSVYSVELTAIILALQRRSKQTK